VATQNSQLAILLLLLLVVVLRLVHRPPDRAPSSLWKESFLLPTQLLMLIYYECSRTPPVRRVRPSDQLVRDDCLLNGSGFALHHRSCVVCLWSGLVVCSPAQQLPDEVSLRSARTNPPPVHSLHASSLSGRYQLRFVSTH
jgi:hypothetical protein